MHASANVVLILDVIAELEADCRKCCAEESENALSKVCLFVPKCNASLQ